MRDKKQKKVTIITMGLILTALLLLVNGLSQVTYADDLFVKTDGSGTACTQGAPCILLTAMGQVADNDTVYIAEGTYTGTDTAVMMITNSISIYGGWDGAPLGPVLLNPETHVTTIDGEETRRCAQVTAPVTVVFNGFTMTNGRHNEKGGGLYTLDAAITLNSMVFYHNAATDPGTDYSFGGGAMIEGGLFFAGGCTFRGNSANSSIFPQGGGLAIVETLFATIEDCLFEDNDSWAAGGLYFIGPTVSFSPLTIRRCNFSDNGWGNSLIGVSAYEGACMIVNASASVEDSTFIHNRSTADYGAIGVINSELTFVRNIISGNTSGRTSGLFLSVVSNLNMTNNVIVDNESTYSWEQYPCVYIFNSSGQLLHNTFGRNSGAYGIQLAGGSDITLTNTIIAGHTVGILVESGCSATMEATLWGTGSWANGTDWDGAGTVNTGTVNIWNDPDFVDPDGNDYHIIRESAAVDTGVDAGVTTDIDNDSRPLIGAYDIGADEYNPLAAFGDELTVDFGVNGLWHHDGSSWSKLTNWDSDDDLAGWNGGLGVDFGTNGVWNNDGSSWSRLTIWDAGSGGLTGWNGGLAVDFGGNGLWSYNGAWTKLTSWDADDDLTGWSGGLGVDFGGNGLWINDGSSWARITTWNVGSAGLAGWNSSLAADFDTSGLWSFDGSAWHKLTIWDPEDDLTGWSGGLAVDFGANGLWSYNGSSWAKLTTWDAGVMTGVSDGLIVDFGINGVWKYTGVSWTKLTHWDAENMDDTDLN